MAIHEIFVIVRNVNGMVLCESYIDTVDFWEMDTSRLGQQNGGQCPNISSGIGTLKLGLHIIRHFIGLGKSKHSIVSSHPLEGTQDHSGLAMDGDGSSQCGVNVGLVHDTANLFAKADSILGERGNCFGLKQPL
jgi:hypothetical protein